MKKIICKLLLLAAVAVLMTGVVLSAALAESAVPADAAALAERLRTVQDFKFKHHKDGIGLGACPVYSAPSEDSYRDGNPTVGTDSEIWEAGFVHGWLLVRYQTNDGSAKVGYIPRHYAEKYKSPMGSLSFDAIPITLAQPIAVTDNPLKANTGFTTLYPETVVYVLAKYTYSGNWYYIEFTTAGQVARGFIDRSQLSFWLGAGMPADPSVAPLTLETLGNPEQSPLGTTQTGDVIIFGNGERDRKNVRDDASPNARQITVVYPGRTYPCYGEKAGYAGITWYYIWVEQDSDFGWVISTYAKPVK